MTLTELIEEIKLELTGNVLELEIEDKTVELAVNKCLRELSRYWDETKMITVPFAPCIDLKDFDSSAVVKVYRTEGVGNNDGNNTNDPFYMQQWMIFSNAGTMYNLQDYMLNYTAWSTMSQIRNTMSTDMSFKEDKQANKLYINQYMGTPSKITIEFIPKLKSVEDIQSDYWIDMLVKFTIAETKILLGRIRTRFTQSNSLWTQDGEKLLEEGNTELKELREVLRSNDNLIVGID